MPDDPKSEQCNLGDLFRPDFAMTDRGYRNMAAAGMMPPYITCLDCGETATFRDDTQAARYECQRCGHAVAAMYADPVVAGMTAQSDFMQAREAQWKILDKGFEYRLLCRHCVQSCVVQKTGMISGALAVPILDHERMHIHVASNLRQMRHPR